MEVTGNPEIISGTEIIPLVSVGMAVNDDVPSPSETSLSFTEKRHSIPLMISVPVVSLAFNDNVTKAIAVVMTPAFIRIVRSLLFIFVSFLSYSFVSPLTIGNEKKTSLRIF